ncbi:MAG: hypothetical protein IIB46_02860 [Nitrospinae bacterium]|nr:hypothetical protein [Nitrospinota bacterium]
MKKILLLTAIFIASTSVAAFAGTINPGQSTSCTDASAIELEVVKTAPAFGGTKNGFTTNDRGTGNLVVWKSSNYTTIPITLGPNDDNRSIVATDNGRTGLSPMGEMGASKVVLSQQSSFSRGDSIGDISGTVKITNTGTVAVMVNCK